LVANPKALCPIASWDINGVSSRVLLSVVGFGYVDLSVSPPAAGTAPTLGFLANKHSPTSQFEKYMQNLMSNAELKLAIR
jgi:hypothetical protein